LLTAATVANPSFSDAQLWSPELLVESLLKAQVQQWAVAGLTDEHLDLLYEMTLTQGACRTDAEFMRHQSLSTAANEPAPLGWRPRERETFTLGGSRATVYPTVDGVLNLR
jgi:hypothetical protein